MLIGADRYFSENFKDKLFCIIDKAREKFKINSLNEFEMGSRFHDDNRVLDECLTKFFNDGIPSCFTFEQINEDQIVCICKFLALCGRIDYWYSHEKQWT